MNLLLDTHAFLWLDNAKLPKRVVTRIERADRVFVSAATAWEIAIKSALGKLRARKSTADALAIYGFTELPVQTSHTDALRSLPNHHRDPSIAS